jgi:hypothetical protein
MVQAAILGTSAMAVWHWPFHHTTGWSAILYVIPGATVIYVGVYILAVRIGGAKSSLGDSSLEVRCSGRQHEHCRFNEEPRDHSAPLV